MILKKSRLRSVFILLLVTATFFVSTGVEKAEARSGFGNTLRLTGDGEAVTATTGGDLDITGNITLECWFFTKSTDSANSNNAQLIYKAAAYFLKLNFSDATTAVITGRVVTGAGNQDVISTGKTITQDTWHHVAFVRNAGTGTLYLDGVSVKQNTGFDTGSILTPVAVLAIGGTGSSNRLIGMIDDVKVSNTNQTIGATPPDVLVDDANTMALYRFDEANNVTSFTDSGANDSVTDTLTASGSTVTDVKLARFKAVPKSNKIVLKWKTDSETDNAGFNILRSDSRKGDYEVINDVPIPSEANDAIGGANYKYPDVNVEVGNKYFYKLVDFDIDEKETEHGPVKAKIKNKNKRQKKHKKNK